jgi:lysophospholipase L1-like esterase
MAANILLIGDSMAEAIAKPLEKSFRGTSNNYTYCFKRGTRTDFWLGNQLLFEKLQESSPNYIIISLGTNDIVAKKSNEKIIFNLDKLIYSIQFFGYNKAKFLIIAPPIQADNDLGLAMRDHYGKFCFPSKELNLTIRSDGFHPTAEADKAWSRSIFLYMLELFT